MITVFLKEHFGNLEEGFAFNVDYDELFSKDDIIQRQKDIYNFLKVSGHNEETYYIRKEIVTELNERMVF